MARNNRSKPAGNRKPTPRSKATAPAKTPKGSPWSTPKKPGRSGPPNVTPGTGTSGTARKSITDYLATNPYSALGRKEEELEKKEEAKKAWEETAFAAGDRSYKAVLVALTLTEEQCSV